MINDYKIAFLLPAYMGSNHSLFLGVGYLAAVVKQRGNSAIIIDEDAIRWIYSSEGDEESLKLAEKRVIDEIRKYSPNMICMSMNTANYKNALRVLQYVRCVFKETYTVVGGPHISVCYKSFWKWHRDLFDAAIIGEGEIALCALIDNVRRGVIDKTIPGVFYSNAPEIYTPGKMVEIDHIPFPDRNAFFEIYDENEILLAKENYQRVFYSHLPGFENGHARVVASRGCYNNCTFCSPGMYWRNPQNNIPCRRIRNAKSVVDEIEALVACGIGAVYFDDSTFPIKSDIAFFSIFEREILERKLKFYWGAPICSNEIDTEILDRLQRIGFSYCYFGLESYCEEYLNDFHKKQDIERCLDLIRECRERGIHCDASYQIGLPNEKIDDIKKSIDWIFQNGIERNTFYSITAIWPGTDMAREYGITDDYYEPAFEKKKIEENKGLYFYEQGNPIVEQFYSNCSGTYHFIPMDVAIDMKYYVFDKGLSNRFAKKRGS